MYIKDDTINQFFNELHWKHAQDLYNKDAIHSITVVKIENQYQIVGQIADNHKIYQGHVTVDTLGSVLSFSCNCGDCQENNLACGHIGVLLLKFYSLELKDIPFEFHKENTSLSQIQEIESQGKQREIEQRIEMTKTLIEKYRHQNINHHISIQENVHIIPTVQYSFSRMYVEYRIAGKRSYLIKGLKDFSNAFKSGQIISYGKLLTIEHNLSNFDDSSKKIISFLRGNVDNIVDKKLIRIDHNNIDEFYLSHFDSLSINLNFTTIDLDNFSFELEKNEDYTVFKHIENEGEFIVGHRYLYYYHNNILNRYSQKISQLLIPIMNSLDEGRIIIENPDLPYFSKYILDQIMPYVSISGDSIDEYLPMEISCIMYMDFSPLGELTVSLEFKDEEGQTLLEDFHNLILPLKIDLAIEYLEDHMEYDDLTNMFFLKDESEIYNFIIHIIPQLDTTFEIYVSEDVKQINRPKNLNMKIGVQLKNNLLEIDLDSINVDKSEIKDIVLAYQNQKSYHRLKNGEFVDLSNKALKDLSYLIDDLNIDQDALDDGKILLDRSNALYVENILLQQENIDVSRSHQFSDLIQHVKNIRPTAYPIPESLSDTLRDYQIDGYQWLKTMSAYGFGGILADDMGLGKTLQVISLLETSQKPSLVVTPATLILNWKDEINKFTSHTKILCIMGSAHQRNELIQHINDYDIIITSYDYMRKDYQLYDSYHFEYLIIDEAQYIKNQNTKNAKSVKKIKSQHRFALTGTPIENSLAELWSIFDFLMPGYLYSYHYFREQFERPIINNHDDIRQEKLKSMVEPFILRRTKKDVLNELPDKIENNINISFNEHEEKIYLSNLSTINQDLQNALQVNHVDNIAILAMMTRLRQLCCDQRILYPEYDYTSSKMDACLDIIKNAKENKQKVLLFSSFTSALDLLEKELRKNDISYYVLTGSTNKIKRHQLVNAFQKDKTDVFLISLKAGGTGLNLTSASIVIHYDPWWNMSSQNQATDRAYRIGQTSNVQVYKLIMKNSIEEKIQDLQSQKQNLSDVFVENSHGSLSSLSHDQIIDLFKA